MTTPDTDAGVPIREPKAESFLDWFHINSRLVSIGALAVLVAGGVAWYVPTYRAQKNANAGKALLAARQSAASGNLALAESDLRKVVDRYAGTSAGTDAGMLLAQLKFDKADYAGAVADLRILESKMGKSPSAPAVQALIGDALAQQGKAAEGAVVYEKAASMTTMANERALYLAKAGHAFTAAGKQPEARKVWEALAAQTDNEGLAAEARVRLGELTATVHKS